MAFIATRERVALRGGMFVAGMNLCSARAKCGRHIPELCGVVVVEWAKCVVGLWLLVVGTRGVIGSIFREADERAATERPAGAKAQFVVAFFRRA